MKKNILFSIFLLLFSTVFSQETQRSNRSFAQAPFFHGVASGDPLADAVMLWTRVTPADGSGNDIDVYWQVATDTAFTNVVNFGKTEATATGDYTVKLDVCGLQPSTYYYYVFQAYGTNSIIGRTKTAPQGANSEVKFGVASCSSYEHGYFNAYESMSKRNDLDAIIHLGDYIYEYETGGFSSSVMTNQGRVYVPGNEAITLTDYRARHSHYKLDDQLQLLHQVHPFITTWDDHETANDAYKDGAENHDGSEGLWQDRKISGTQAYSEWMPIRNPDPNDPLKIWRKLRYGDLLDLIVLDSRLWGRDEQDMGATDDNTRSLLGADQFAWLETELSDNTTQWKIITQQVMLAPLEIFGAAVNADQWDGYNADRQRLISFIENNNVTNPVVLTGDIHSTFINNVEGDNGTAASEFVVTSVTSPGIDVVEVALGNLPQWLLDIVGGTVNGALEFFNDHMQYVNMEDHGYMVLTIDDSKAQGDYIWLDREVIDTTEDFATSWYVNDGVAGMNEANNPIAVDAGTGIFPPLAPVQTIPFAILPDTFFVSIQNGMMLNECIINTTGACPTLTTSISINPEEGVANLTDFCFAYQAPTNFVGVDEIEVEVCPTSNPLDCETVIVQINVGGTTNIDTITYSTMNTEEVTDCFTFDDLYTGVSTYSYIYNGNATVLFDNIGCFTYTPDTSFCGIEYVAFVACDSIGVCDTIVAEMIVDGESSTQYIMLTAEQEELINYCLGFDDLQGDITNVDVFFNTDNGNALEYNDTCMSYVSAADFVGNDTIMMVACDDFVPQKCDTILYVITVDADSTMIPIHEIENDEFAILGVYPNPFETEILIQYYQFKETPLRLTLYNVMGQQIFDDVVIDNTEGRKYARIGAEGLSSGEYILHIHTEKYSYTQKVVKY
ncbi:MAG: alkaline phosphatase D family protein [Chitinophagales bacterium]